jgi:hypothetical protein
MKFIRKKEFLELEDEILLDEYKKISFLEKMGLLFFISFFALSIFQST